MIMNCCTTASDTNNDKTREALADEIGELCCSCHGQSRRVSRKTVLLMLKPELLERGLIGTYSFCATADCPVVYFDDRNGHSFTVEDLRVKVGVKASEDPIPLCYCFGFDESHLRDEIAGAGRTNVPERISNLIREGLCACDSRNPAGVCCLGEVNRVAKRLLAAL